MSLVGILKSYWPFFQFNPLRPCLELPLFSSVPDPEMRRIRIQLGSGSGSGSRMLMTRNYKSLPLEQKSNFSDRIGVKFLHRPPCRTYLTTSYRRSLLPSKENIRHFKTWIFFSISVFVGNCCRPKSGSGSRRPKSMRIPYYFLDTIWIFVWWEGSGSVPYLWLTDPGPRKHTDPDPQHWLDGEVFWKNFMFC